MRELSEKTSEEIVDLYYELIFAVERKFVDESRHETALRYIQEMERRTTGPAQEIEINVNKC